MDEQLSFLSVPPQARVESKKTRMEWPRGWTHTDERVATYEAFISWWQAALNEQRVCKHTTTRGRCFREECKRVEKFKEEINAVANAMKALPMEPLDVQHICVKAELGREADGHFVVHAWRHPGVFGRGPTQEQAEEDWHANVAKAMAERRTLAGAANDDAVRDEGHANEDDDVGAR